MNNKEYQREYYLKHKKQINEQAKEYRENHKEDMIEYRKKYRKNNLEKIKQQNKEYWINNKIERQQYNQEYYKENKDRIINNSKEYYANNTEKKKEYSREKSKEKITFKGKRVILNHNPRIGICSNCHKRVIDGEIKQTQMHHTQYDESNPLAFTVELCPSCHQKIHKQKQ